MLMGKEFTTSQPIVALTQKLKNLTDMTDQEFNRRLDEFLGEPVKTEQVADPRFTEKRIHKTPNGGDYSIAYYYNAEHRPCVKAEAAFVNIVEYTKNGERINENYGVLGA